MTDKVIVLTTAGSDDEARKIARALVERQVAACVNILPQITSLYRWQGAVEESREWLLLIKTTGENFRRVRETIAELHSYDVPECISLAVEDGSKEYLDWIAASVAPPPA